MNEMTKLDVPGLESVYDMLAEAIDQVGEAKTALFLAKLALLNASALANPVLFRRHIESALEDL